MFFFVLAKRGGQQAVCTLNASKYAVYYYW